jgi:ribose/xylose/arabinose/galactoside ABC-type transport system permease subunit
MFERRASMIFGAFTGVLLLGVISKIPTLWQVFPFWIQASQPAITLGALLFQRVATGEKEE